MDSISINICYQCQHHLPNLKDNSNSDHFDFIPDIDSLGLCFMHDNGPNEVEIEGIPENCPYKLEHIVEGYGANHGGES
jgi:hypothetical protein